MIEVDYLWLKLNQHVFGNVRFKEGELQRLIQIYNSITGENQKMTGCGRCIANIKKRVKIEYDRYESL